MRFTMLGNSEFILHCTQALLDIGANVCSMIAEPEDVRPNNALDLRNFAGSNEIPYKELEDINSNESISFLSALNSDFIFCEWPKILGKEVLETQKYHCIGTHPTDLPHNRGRHPLHWSICLNISKTKLSFFIIDKGVDTGDILLQIPFSINPDENISEVVNKVNNIAYEGTQKLYNMLLSNVVYHGEKQNHSLANYWRKRTPHDLIIDLRMSANCIKRTVRSYTPPYTCAKLMFKNYLLKIVNASSIATDMSSEQLQRIEPGKIISIDNNKEIQVKVDDGIISLKCLDKLPDELLITSYIHPPSKYFADYNKKD